jgi:hypothetical protein
LLRRSDGEDIDDRHRAIARGNREHGGKVGLSALLPVGAGPQSTPQRICERVKKSAREARTINEAD